MCFYCIDNRKLIVGVWRVTSGDKYCTIQAVNYNQDFGNLYKLQAGLVAEERDRTFSLDTPPYRIVANSDFVGFCGLINDQHKKHDSNSNMTFNVPFVQGEKLQFNLKPANCDEKLTVTSFEVALLFVSENWQLFEFLSF